MSHDKSTNYKFIEGLIARALHYYYYSKEYFGVRRFLSLVMVPLALDAVPSAFDAGPIILEAGPYAAAMHVGSARISDAKQRAPVRGPSG